MKNNYLNFVVVGSGFVCIALIVMRDVYISV